MASDRPCATRARSYPDLPCTGEVAGALDELLHVLVRLALAQIPLQQRDHFWLGFGKRHLAQAACDRGFGAEAPAAEDLEPLAGSGFVAHADRGGPDVGDLG